MSQDDYKRRLETALSNPVTAGGDTWHVSPEKVREKQIDADIYVTTNGTPLPPAIQSALGKYGKGWTNV